MKDLAVIGAGRERDLVMTDPYVSGLLSREWDRQAHQLRLIASENYMSPAVRQACASVIGNQYSEGYPGKRYYQGQEFVDKVELIAIARARQLFMAEHVNVQPYSGSPANLAVYVAMLQLGDPVLGMALSHGGHLTHGSAVSVTGKYWNVRHYGVAEETGLIDYETVQAIAMERRPKIIIAGHSAYPRKLEFQRFRDICDECGALLWADISHIAGLIAGGGHESPFGIADIVTTTTHKSLRGPRGAMVFCKSEFADRIDKAVFPGLQGGPHNSTIAGIAVALHEAQQPVFADYVRKCLVNAKAMAEELRGYGIQLVTGGTDNHIVLLDLRSNGLDGKSVAEALERAGIVSNSNSVPNDTRPASSPSGLRLGSPSLTTRGLSEDDFRSVGRWIGEVIQSKLSHGTVVDVAARVGRLAEQYPVC